MKEITLECKSCRAHRFNLSMEKPLLYIHKEAVALNECPNCDELTEYDVTDADTIQYKCADCDESIPGVPVDELDPKKSLHICFSCSEQRMFEPVKDVEQ